METKSYNRESKSCSAKYGIFYRFVYMRDSCSANSCSARLTLCHGSARHSLQTETVLDLCAGAKLCIKYSAP
ncbi:hypothetical protein E2C01_044999 [Portunus trituberculatus]|uniref:Uncharacterized protein n=1 Tax=Portunus trituberculatus TaxID=210409 RepID=A0A5B7G0X5_PORTR|nr:hypothetical protein [Portunus trituberculatus]